MCIILQTEKQTLKAQCESLQKEISHNTELQTQLSGRIHELEKDNIVLKNQAEEAVHRSRVEQTNLKMDMLKERGELERQRDMASNTVEGEGTTISCYMSNPFSCVYFRLECPDRGAEAECRERARVCCL